MFAFFPQQTLLKVGTGSFECQTELKLALLANLNRFFHRELADTVEFSMQFSRVLILKSSPECITKTL
jgi:hypothetical protein